MNPLSYWQVGLAASLVLINGLISIGLRLQMERTLLVASLRTVVQLLMVGLLLDWVFAIQRWYIVIALFVAMTCIAGTTAAQRVQRCYRGIWWDTLISVWLSSWTITGFALLIVLGGLKNWYHPQYAIPFLGMLLGNALNGISLGLGTFTESLSSQRDQIESLLAIGATRWEAARRPLRDSLRMGMTPIINSMMVVGIVSLPGMMTGQILSGTAPTEAVKYQIVIMFLIAATTALGTLVAVLLTYRRLFNRDHQFLYRLLYRKERRV